MATPKTTAVLLKDGRSGRGVKVSAKNVFAISGWIRKLKGDATAKFKEVKGEEVQWIVVAAEGGLRVAAVGDTIVKLVHEGTKKVTFKVIKAADFEKFIKI